MINTIYTKSGHLADENDAEEVFEQAAYLLGVDDKIPEDKSTNNFEKGIQSNYHNYGGSIDYYLDDDLEISVSIDFVENAGSASLFLGIYDNGGRLLESKELKELPIKIEKFMIIM